MEIVRLDSNYITRYEIQFYEGLLQFYKNMFDNHVHPLHTLNYRVFENNL